MMLVARFTVNGTVCLPVGISDSVLDVSVEKTRNVTIANHVLLALSLKIYE